MILFDLSERAGALLPAILESWLRRREEDFVPRSLMPTVSGELRHANAPKFLDWNW
jgi:hypothetical protein